MKKTVLVFGLLSGAVSAAMMLGTIPFIDRIGFDHTEVLGYTTLVASFLLVFFGVRSYRENVGGGTLSFGRALSLGLLITLVSCVCYVATWEFIYYRISPDFADKYAVYAVEKARASGASQAKIDATTQQMEAFKEMYKNPIFNIGLTFMEPLPVGVLVALISAAVLRRKPRP